MPDATTLPIPVEIPWQLAATTQVLGPDTLPPGTTTIALFTYTPKIESLEKDYPDERFVYLKFTVSISPPAFFSALRAFELKFFWPTWYAILDLKVTPPIPFTEGGSRPYFHAASPVRRTMIETGIVGGQLFEGEANGLAVGKSGSQIHESQRTSTETSDWKVGGSVNVYWLGLGASKSGTGVTTSSDRDVTQQVDTTNREASQERRELLSHTTNVNNVLTLLTAKYVGTPYLRFNLWQQPLRPLTIDPSDPNLWYAELLNRRSSGIEGMQDFYAIVVIPRALPGFCITADLTRFSVIDALPPEPSDFEAPASLSPSDSAEVTKYLHNRYPRGTPLSELDVDLEKDEELRPAVDHWSVFPVAGIDLANLRYSYVRNAPVGFFSEQATVYYKTAAEVWLEMRRAQYERELASSPLKLGAVSTLTTTLNTCFDLVGDNGIMIRDVSSNAGSPMSLSFNGGGTVVRYQERSRDIDKYRAAVFSWNALENRLRSQVSSVQEWETRPFRFDDPAVVGVFLRGAALLGDDDPANQTLDRLLGWVNLAADHVTALREMNVSNLRGLAAALDAAPAVERINRDRNKAEEYRRRIEARGCSDPTPSLPHLEPIPFTLSSEDAAAIRARFGEALQTRFEQNQGSPDLRSLPGEDNVEDVD